MGSKSRFLGLGLLLAAATLAGCKGDDAGEAGDITVGDKTTLAREVFAGETSGKSGVSFTTAGAWRSSITGAPATKAGEPAWVSIDPDHGDAAGEYTVAIALETNYPGEDRAATIHVTRGDTGITLNVARKGVKEDGEVPGPAPVVASGTTGACTWTVSGWPGDYHLVIGGNGATGAREGDVAPWRGYLTGLKTLVVQDGVTGIRDYAFGQCSATSVPIGGPVTSIGEYAFYKFSRAGSITIPARVATIGKGAFTGSGWTTMTILNPTPPTIAADVFDTGNIAKYQLTKHRASNDDLNTREICEH